MTANNPGIGNISLMDLLHNVSYMNENKDKNLYLTVYIPTEFSFSVIVLLIIVYSISITLSFIGNLAVIFVFLCGKRAKRDVASFLINLALADLLMAGFCMPYTFTETMLAHWIFGRIMCPLIHFMQILSVSVSIGTNVVIGIDR